VDQWLSDVYTKNKVLFWVILPFCAIVILFFGFKDLILRIIVEKSNEELAKSKIDDASLSEKEKAAKRAAEDSKKIADSIEEQIKSIEEDEDWNKKRGEISDLGILMIIFALGVIYCLGRLII
jgi:flagellar biosynthesis/type III secretory pathway M-ring protein FliF/YscJ